MLELWPSIDRLLSNITPNFLTDYKDLTEYPSMVGIYSRFLGERSFGPMAKTLVFFLNLEIKCY